MAKSEHVLRIVLDLGGITGKKKTKKAKPTKAVAPPRPRAG